MSKKHLVVIGGGFSGLKLVKLLRSTRNSDYTITLISDSKTFVFFPLLPDYIGGRVRDLSDFTSKISEFCNAIGVKYINDKCVSINEEKRLVVLQKGGELWFNRCVLCTGLSHASNHIKLWKFLSSLNDGDPVYKSQKMGLAEFEIIAALEEIKKNIKIKNYSRYKDLSTHWVKTTMSHNGLSERFSQINGYINKNTKIKVRSQMRRRKANPISKSKNVQVIGAALDEVGGEYSSAQRSSYSAHVAAYEFRYGTEAEGISERIYTRLQRYRSKGVMLFVRSDSALIWIGSDTRGHANISGRLASVIRLVFYRIEFWLYYKTAGAPLALCRLINRIHMWLR